MKANTTAQQQADYNIITSKQADYNIFSIQQQESNNKPHQIHNKVVNQQFWKFYFQPLKSDTRNFAKLLLVLLTQKNSIPLECHSKKIHRPNLKFAKSFIETTKI